MLQAVISNEINQTLIDSTQEVLVEKTSDMEDFLYVGKSRKQAPSIDSVTYVKVKTSEQHHSPLYDHEFK
jgi:ribosomal protein S12 methylthiotransferase